MFGIGETELVIIVVFAFLLFGPDKLPGMGRTLGRVLRQFREASDGFTEVVQTNIMDPASEELEKSPKQRQREAAEALDEDANVEVTGSQEETPRRETFAERRERLKAEREAAERAAAETPAEQPAEQEAVDAPEEPEEAPRTSAADLYAMSSRKSSRTLADEAKAAEQSAADVTGEEDGSEGA